MISNDQAMDTVCDAMTFIDTHYYKDSETLIPRLRELIKWVELQVDGQWEERDGDFDWLSFRVADTLHGLSVNLLIMDIPFATLSLLLISMYAFTYLLYIDYKRSQVEYKKGILEILQRR